MMWLTRALEFVRQFFRSRRLRAAGKVVVATALVLEVLAYFGVPLLLGHIVRVQVATALHRPASVGKIRFNLYTLRLDLEQLHIGDRDGAQPFVDVGHLGVRASWTSLFRLAPIVREVTIDRPSIHITRTAEQRFSFSDLMESAAPAPTPAAPGKPMRFAVSNIRLNDGEVRFNDRVLGKEHAIEHVEIGIPFIANLPADVDVFVEPLLQMTVDGSPLKLGGKAKPFSSPPESELDLNIHRLDLARYAGYLPARLPLKIPGGTFSCAMQIHFVMGENQPVIRLNGAAALDQIDVRDGANAALLGLAHGEVKLTDVEPLGGVIHLDTIRLDGLTANLALNADGTTNLTPLMGGNAAPPAIQPQAASPAKAGPPDVSLESFQLTRSAVNLTDNAASPPAVAGIKELGVSLKGLRLNGQTPAPFQMGAKLGGGGAISIKGALALAQSQVTAEVALDQIDLPALQPFAQPFLAANVAAGKLSVHGNLRSDFASGRFNLHVEPATVALDNLDVRAASGAERPIGWNRLAISIGQIDLAARQAVVTEVRADSIHLFVRRQRDGVLSLAALARSPGSSAPRPSNGAKVASVSAAAPAPSAASAPAKPWRYQVESIGLEKTEARFEDDTTSRPAVFALSALNLRLKDVSDDFAKPIGLDLNGTLNNKGGFAVSGTAAIAPLDAKLRVSTVNLQLAAGDPYVGGGLNATIARAALTASGALSLKSAREGLQVSYRGDATLGNFKLLDKATGGDLLKWNALKASRINFRLRPPEVHVGAIALDDFRASAILNHDGKLNLRDLTAGPKSPPASPTAAGSHPEQVAAQVALPSPSQPSAGPSTDIEIGRITLQGGKVQYADNFIEPNYSAELEDIGGRVGSFGTHAQSPAELELKAELNGSAPIDISGSVNPLAPAAFIDVRAKADGVELTGFAPYSAKYTGYPIVKGTLTFNLHYQLENQKLTAENHILIDQLTFGDRVESRDATNLPVRLAVSLLKDSKGAIDLDIPVSGSLSDPKFSVGSVILHTLTNLIARAATSPFSLLAGAIGAVAGGSQSLDLVEFPPGLASLTPDSRKKLEVVATALKQRPAIRLDILGRVDPNVDRDGLREAILMRQIRAQKIAAAGSAAAGADAVELTPTEYDKYLGRVYAAAKFPKPSNFLGMDKSLPPDEMKKLLLTNTEVTDKALAQLASARAGAVRKSLSAKIDPSRLFVLPSKLNANGIQAGATTRVDLSLE